MVTVAINHADHIKEEHQPSKEEVSKGWKKHIRGS